MVLCLVFAYLIGKWQAGAGSVVSSMATHHRVAKPPVTGAANIGFDGQKSNEVFLQFSGRSLRFHLKDQQESPPHITIIFVVSMPKKCY